VIGWKSASASTNTKHFFISYFDPTAEGCPGESLDAAGKYANERAFSGRSIFIIAHMQIPGFQGREGRVKRRFRTPPLSALPPSPCGLPAFAFGYGEAGGVAGRIPHSTLR
jgi:hypothetical protein